MSYIHDMVDKRNIEIDNVGICRYKLPMTFESENKYNVISEIGAGVSLKSNIKGAHLSRIIKVLDEMIANKVITIYSLNYVLEELDMVLIMTVNPGYGGQSYIAKMDDKIKELRAIINEKGLDIDIEVDGGISAKNVAHVKECGANVFVAGSAVFNGDIASSAKDILEAMEA